MDSVRAQGEPGRAPDHLSEGARLLGVDAGVTPSSRPIIAAWCDISVRQREDVVVLEIANDGVARPDSGPGSGAGIRNMSDRVARVGGQLTAGMDEDGMFRLRALVLA